MSNKQNDHYEETKRESQEELSQKRQNVLCDINYKKGFNEGLRQSIEIINSHYAPINGIGDIERKIRLLFDTEHNTHSREEYDKAMQDMECWSVDEHLKKCENHPRLEELKVKLIKSNAIVNSLGVDKENLVDENCDLYKKIEDLCGYLEAILEGKYKAPFWHEIPDVVKECNDFLKKAISIK